MIPFGKVFNFEEGIEFDPLRLIIGSQKYLYNKDEQASL